MPFSYSLRTLQQYYCIILLPFSPLLILVSYILFLHVRNVRIFGFCFTQLPFYQKSRECLLYLLGQKAVFILVRIYL